MNYTFSVDGSVEPGAKANDSDTIDGTTVDGHVEGGIDDYWVTGDFTSFEIDGDVTVRLDGETVDPDSLVTVVREVVIDGGATSDRVWYTFGVDGTIERGSAANDNDVIEGTSVSGQVEGGIDSYQITGEFTNFQVDGDAPVRIDGETVDPATLGPDHDLPHELVVIGDKSPASYRVETTGSVAKRDGMWGAESDDSADGAVASGTVKGDRDTFGFSGTVVQLAIDGNASLTFGE
ncbi:hypothetical protein [Halobellus ordinarius]|uniref:hypothetical protein n=1 Tax=Halobellus ordinarius TaxID=3075120 RepID=UPI00288020CF|nr:hypothetical protein [Halobellus sp. ZY16]